MSPDRSAALRTALRAAERNAEAARGALTTAEATVAALRAILDLDAPPSPDDLLDSVPLAVAARAWNCSKDAARMRARRGAGVRASGRWFVPRKFLPPTDPAA